MLRRKGGKRTGWEDVGNWRRKKVNIITTTGFSRRAWQSDMKEEASFFFFLNAASYKKKKVSWIERSCHAFPLCLRKIAKRSPQSTIALRQKKKRAAFRFYLLFSSMQADCPSIRESSFSLCVSIVSSFSFFFFLLSFFLHFPICSQFTMRYSSHYIRVEKTRIKRE